MRWRSKSAGVRGRGAGAGVLREAGRVRYQARMKALFGSSLIAYWPIGEPSGTTMLDVSGNGRHGTYTGVTLAQPGTGDGGTSGLWDGVNDYANAYSPGLAGDFNGAEGTMMCWAKVANAGVWTDGALRRLWVLSVDASNQIVLRTNITANSLIVFYVAGGVSKNINFSGGSLDWFHIALTWSKAADQLKIFLNGAQQGATQTSLGVWTGSPIIALLGALSSTPTNVWHGWLDEPLILNRAATAAEIAQAARV